LRREAFAPLPCEFDFRYSNRIALGFEDPARNECALKAIVGKRLTYRWPSDAASAYAASVAAFASRLARDDLS
jgi:hypothetical protein